MRNLAGLLAVFLHAFVSAQWDTLRFSSNSHELGTAEQALFANGPHDVDGVQIESKWTRTAAQSERNRTLTDQFGMIPETEFLSTRTYLTKTRVDSCNVRSFKIDLTTRHDGMSNYPWWGLFDLSPESAECLRSKGVRSHEGRFVLVMYDQKLVALKLPSTEETTAIEEGLVSAAITRAVRPMKFWREDCELVKQQGVLSAVDSIDFLGFRDLLVKDGVVRGTEVWCYHADTIRITDAPVTNFDLGAKAPRQEVTGHVDPYGRPDEWQFLFAPTHEQFLRDVSGGAGAWWGIAQFLGRPWTQRPDGSRVPPVNLDSRFRYYTHNPIMDLVAEQKERAAREKADKEKYAAERASLISKYGSNYGPAIHDGNLMVGMTKEMVDLASRRLFTVEGSSWQNGKEIVRTRHVLGASMTLVFSKEGKLLEFRTQ